jgi:F-type H+-transporting ATPase subunit delta
VNEQIVIARRYAHAFLNVFIESLSNNDLTNIEQAIDFFTKHKQLIALLKVPHIDTQQKSDALEYILLKIYHLPESFKKLVSLLVSQKRAYYILEVLIQLNEYYQIYKNIEYFQIKSSHQLEQKELELLEQFLKEQTEAIIIYKYEIDPDLIAGIRMQSNTLLWEYSIQKQLNALTHQLKQG